MKILILGTAGNGLNQRTLCALRSAGHQSSIEPIRDADATCELVESAKPDLVFCLLPVDRLASATLPPSPVWRHWRTVVVTAGPGPEPPSVPNPDLARLVAWRVTAQLLVPREEAVTQSPGPWIQASILDHREIRLPSGIVRRSALYRGPIADLVASCAVAVTTKAGDPGFLKTAQAKATSTLAVEPVAAPAVLLEWGGSPMEIVRTIRAADGSIGASTKLFGRPARVFDAHLGVDQQGCAIAGPCGMVIARHEAAVLVGTGVGSVWLGQVARPTATGPGLKLPAATALRGGLRSVPVTPNGPPPWLTYRRTAKVGTLSFRPYNGALSTRACRQLLVALRYAMAQPTQALVIRGGDDLFCTGMHLGMIESAVDSAAEAWANTRALNAVCRRICALSSQLVIAALTGDAAAGGAMLGLGAQVVVARKGIVLHPYYGLGLSGSQLHSYSLPLRVGQATAGRLLSEGLPLEAEQAQAIGLVDEVGPTDPAEFSRWLAVRAADLAAGGPSVRSAAHGRSARSQARALRSALPRRPLSYYETAELAVMARDIFDDRKGFAAQRRSFLAR
jgi:putative two-component system hydrogenase maturation factor HypX/HoxX